MPVVNVEGKRINFPDTMSREEIAAALDAEFGAGKQPQPAPEPTGSYSPLAIGGELASAANRSVADIADFFGPGSINAGLRLFGSDYQLPTFRQGMEATPGGQGNFMPEGTARDVVQGAGGALPAATSLVQVPRNLATAGGALMEMAGLGTQRAPGAAQAAANAPGLFGDMATEVPAAMTARADRMGWPLTPGDRLDSPMLKRLESGIESLMIPANPIDAVKAKRQQLMNKAATEALGLETPKGKPPVALTSDVMGSTADDISSVFKNLELEGGIPADAQFADELVNIGDTAKTRLFKDPAINETINNVFDKVDDSGMLEAVNYQDMTSELKQKIRQAWKGESPDPYFAESLAQIVESLDRLAQNSMDPQALSDLKRARAKWKALTQLEKSRAVKESGDVSGPLLANYLRRTDVGGYGRGGNTSDMYEAARLSKAFPGQPDSGTAGRMSLQNMLQNPLGAAFGLALSPVASTLANAYVRGGGSATAARGARRLIDALELSGAQNVGPYLAPVGRATGGYLED